MSFKGKLSDEVVRDIYLTPASNREMAEEYGVSASMVTAIRHRRCYSIVTWGLPKPPFIERRPSTYLEICTEPLLSKHESIQNPTKYNDEMVDYLKEVLPQALRECTKNAKELAVFKLRWLERETLERAGAKVKCSRERVRQIENKLLRKLAWYIAVRVPEKEYRYIDRWLYYARKARSPAEEPVSDPVRRPRSRPKPASVLSRDFVEGRGDWW